MRLISYAIFSVIAAAIIVVHAYHQRREFFTVVVHLSTSKISVAFLSNAFMAILLCIGSTIQTIFFGKLREAEVERLWDKIKTSLFETCFAVTMFRDDIGSSFLLNFLGLLVLKWFHWLCHFRGEFVSQSIHTSALQHVRALTAMLLLGIVDYHTANALYEAMNEKGINVSLIFAFEILVLFALLVSTSLKYLLYMLCSGWSGLRVSVFYINLGSDLFKIFAYLAFFSVVYSVIGIPLHIVGDVYQTLRSLQKRISDFIRYRAINASINHRFPTVSAEELAQAHDITCIVCQSDMVGGTCKRLPCCRRIVHTECIKSWLEEHATCPLCRFNVMSLPVNAAPAADAAPAVIAAAQNTDAIATTQAAAAPAATRAAETSAAASAHAPPSHQNAAQSDASYAAAQSNVSISSVAGTRPYNFNPDYTLSPYRNEVLPANPLSPPPLALLPFPASSLLSPRPAAPMHLHSQFDSFSPCTPSGQPFILPPPPPPSSSMAMYGSFPFAGAVTGMDRSPQLSSPGSGRRLSRNVAVSLALDMAESSKEQYYSLLRAFEESEPSHCNFLLHSVENHLLPSITAASSSLRSLAASASAFDGVLLETKSRELGGIVDSFGSLRKMIADKANQAKTASPLTASTAAAIAAVATQRITAASDAIAVVLPPPQPTSAAFATFSGCHSPPQAVTLPSAASNPFAMLTPSSVLNQAPLAVPNTVTTASSSSFPAALSPVAVPSSADAAQPLHQPPSPAPVELSPRVLAAQAAEARRLANLSAAAAAAEGAAARTAKDSAAEAVASAVVSPISLSLPAAGVGQEPKDDSKLN